MNLFSFFKNDYFSVKGVLKNNTDTFDATITIKDDNILRVETFFGKTIITLSSDMQYRFSPTVFYFGTYSFEPYTDFENMKGRLLKIISVLKYDYVVDDMNSVLPVIKVFETPQHIVLENNKDNLFASENKQLNIYSIDDKLNFVDTIEPFGFESSQLLLNGENTLLSLNALDRKNIASVDLLRTDIVENYKIKHSVNVLDTCSKTPHQLIGINKNGIMTFDTRIKNVLVEDRSLFYGADSKAGITCVASSHEGENIYVGTDKGFVKMYKKKNLEKDNRTDVEKAPRSTVTIKTPSPIYYIDVTSDGEKILATHFDSLSLLIEGEIYNLALNTNDEELYCIEDVPFSKAKFNFDATKIIVSRGKIIIEWSIDKYILKYVISNFDSDVLDKNYTYNNDVVYATSDTFGLKLK